jgi:hypothetical protein
MEYEPTEAELCALRSEEMAADEAQAAFYEEQEEWERQQVWYHHEQEQQGWEDGEYEQMIFEVEGY